MITRLSWQRMDSQREMDIDKENGLQFPSPYQNSQLRLKGFVGSCSLSECVPIKGQMSLAVKQDSPTTLDGITNRKNLRLIYAIPSLIVECSEGRIFALRRAKRLYSCLKCPCAQKPRWKRHSSFLREHRDNRDSLNDS